MSIVTWIMRRLVLQKPGSGKGGGECQCLSGLRGVRVFAGERGVTEEGGGMGEDLPLNITGLLSEAVPT
jgi:hypothetical protein